MNKYFNFEICDVDEEKKLVTCLGFDGNVYRFPLPELLPFDKCDPCQLAKLISLTQKKYQRGEKE